MKIQQSGMILLTTVIILSFVAALLMNLEQLMVSYLNIQKQIKAQHEAYDALHAFSLKLSKTPLSKAPCFDKTDDINTSIQHLKSGEGCIEKDNRIAYRYWVSKLGLHHVFAVQLLENPHATLVLRRSTGHGLVSLRYIMD